MYVTYKAIKKRNSSFLLVANADNNNLRWTGFFGQTQKKANENHHSIILHLAQSAVGLKQSKNLCQKFHVTSNRIAVNTH